MLGIAVRLIVIDPYLGNINIVWKIPDSVNDRDTMKEIDAANAARENIFKFATRQMQKDY